MPNKRVNGIFTIYNFGHTDELQLKLTELVVNFCEVSHYILHG